MKPALTSRLSYLFQRLAADFGNDEAQTVWLDAGSGTWTQIPVLQSRTRPAERELTGLLTLPVDTITLHVKKADWPAVALEVIFRLGPPSAADSQVPAANLPKYRITACPDAPALDWIRIEAQKH